jgi:hypothetical protein
MGEAKMAPDLRAARRTDALFKAVSGDFLLREQFVTDPAQILSEYVHGKRLPDGTAGAANQLLFAVVSNPGLANWMRQYAKVHGGDPPPDEAFARDFARAVAENPDEQVVIALVRGAGEKRDLFTPQSDLLRAIIVALGGGLGSVSAGTEMSPGTGGTEMSPGGGTEMSPGKAFEPGRGGVFAGTEMSPGGGTEMSPGHGTEMSPGGARDPGSVMSGTEMSPGGTEMSPGTGGTEMSPGRFGGQFGGIDVRGTFQALVDFANQLRSRGALNFTGQERVGRARR